MKTKYWIWCLVCLLSSAQEIYPSASSTLDSSFPTWKRTLESQIHKEADSIGKRHPSIARKLHTFADKDVYRIITYAVLELSPQEQNIVRERIKIMPLPRFCVEFVTENLIASVSTNDIITLNPRMSRFSYENFRRTMGHEFIHYYLEGRKNTGEVTLQNSLAEGVTEYICLSVMERISKEKLGLEYYPDAVKSVAIIQAHNLRDKLYEWYVADTTKQAKRDVLDAGLVALLTARGETHAEANDIVLSLHKQEKFITTKLISVEKYRILSVPLMLEVIDIKNEVESINLAIDTFREMGKCINDPNPYVADELVRSKDFSIFIDFIDDSSLGLPNPECISSSAIPLIKMEIARMNGASNIVNIVTNVFTERINHVAQNQKGSERVRSIQTETLLILKEEQDKMHTRVLAKRDEIESIRKNIEHTQTELNRIVNLSGKMWELLALDPTDHARINTTMIPRDVRVALPQH